MANSKPQHHVSSLFSRKLKPESLIVQSKYSEFGLFPDIMHYFCILHEIDIYIMLAYLSVFIITSKTTGFLVMVFGISESMVKDVHLI